MENTAWQLEDFVDSLVVELDKTRETLAIKAINKPLSYSVKELSLDLNIFPSFDGDTVRFLTAQPGQAGASKVTIQLGSITDQQVRATSKEPPRRNDIDINEIPVDTTTKRKLRRLGVNSLDDLEQIEKKNVDLKKVADTDIDYSALANQIQKAKRSRTPPQVSAVSLSLDDERHPCLTLQGRNLCVDPKFEPVVAVNQRLAHVLSRDESELRIRLDDDHAFSDRNDVVVAFDPFACLRVNVKA